MKPVVFAGPSLFGVDRSLHCAHVEIRPPAARGDVSQAVRDGAPRIGIIDGLFGDQPSVGHKEILFALAAGVQVLGAASMGALRAAECHTFGMIGVGRIFRSYRNGTRSADADVAIIHAPGEMGFLPLSEAIVDVEASLEQLKALNLIAKPEQVRLLTSARSLHFSMRTWKSILESASIDEDRKTNIAGLVRKHRINQKQIDALELLEAIGWQRLRQRQAFSHEDLNDSGFLNG